MLHNKNMTKDTLLAVCMFLKMNSFQVKYFLNF